MGSGTFPLTFNQELPSGRAGAPIADPSRLARGGQEIAAAVFQVGKKALALDQFIQEAKGTLDLTNLQRQDSEFKNAALDALDSPDLDIFDDDAITAIKEKADTDRTAQVSKYDTANFNYQNHLGKTSAAWDKSFADRVNEIRTGNLRDNFELNAEDLLGRGDVGGYKTLIANMRNTGVITQTEADYRTKNADTDSILKQASRHLERGNTEFAAGLLNQVDIRKLSIDQLKYRNKLLKATTQTSEEQTNGAIAEVVVQKDNLKGATVLEKTAAAQDMKQSLIDAGVTGNALERWFGILDKWAGGDTDATEEYDPKAYLRVSAQVMLNPDKITPTQIYALVGLGKEGGITTDQAQAFVKLLGTNLKKPGGSTPKEVYNRYQSILLKWYNTGAVYGGGIVEQADKFTAMADKLTTFYTENEDATVAEFDSFWEELTGDVTKTRWYKTLWKFLTKIEQLNPSGPNLLPLTPEIMRQQEIIRKASIPPSTRKLGDTEIKNGITYTLVQVNPEKWHYDIPVKENTK